MDFYNKNILLVIHQGVLGGAERQGIGIAKILTEEYGCRVYLLLTLSDKTSCEFEEFAKECHILKILYVGKPYFLLKREFSFKNIQRLIWSFRYFCKVRKEVKIYSPNIIIPFLNFPSKLSYYLYKFLPSARFTFWHQLGLDNMSLDILENNAVRNIPCIIANADNGLDMFRNIYKVAPARLNILPQYVSLSYVPQEKFRIKSKLGIPEDSVIIGMIAHYRPEKYHELLLNVFEKLCRKYDSIHLLFLGDKNISQATQEKFDFLSLKIREKGLDSKVFLLSNNKVEDVLNVLDIGVLVSRIEGTPNAVLEYMLYRIPVVATDHPGCKDLLKDSPFLIKNNETELFNSLQKLLLSFELRISEGNVNAERIKKYDMATYIKKLEIIMNQTLEK